MEQIMRSFYETWVASEDYRRISVLESDRAKDYYDRIETMSGDASISDECGSLICEGEYTGFKNGLKYGIAFISDMLRR